MRFSYSSKNKVECQRKQLAWIRCGWVGERRSFMWVGEGVGETAMLWGWGTVGEQAF